MECRDHETVQAIREHPRHAFFEFLEYFGIWGKGWLPGHSQERIWALYREARRPSTVGREIER